MSRYLLLALFVAHTAATNVIAQTPTVAVTGSVVMPEGALWPNFSISFANRFAGRTAAPARATFRVNLLQGAYDVEVSGLPAGYTVQSITAGSSDLLKSQLLVMRDEAPPQVTVRVGVSSPPPWVKVNGHVKSERNPITPGLRISLSSPVSDPVSAVVSSDGSFEFPRLLPAAYTGTFAPAPSWATPFSITVPERDLTGVELALPQVKQVSGRIAVDDGGPIPFTTLTLTPGSNVIRPGTRNQIFISLSPQPDGSFKVSLPEGPYGFSVTPQTRKPDGTNLYSVKALTYGDVDLLQNPAVIAAADAELRLTYAPATPNSFVKVSGRVTGMETLVSVAPTGLPGIGSSPQVTLSGAGFVGSLSASLKPDGSFEFPRVYTGSYSVRLASAPLPANVTVPSVSLNVVDKDVTDVAISIPRVREITGRVILDGSGPMPRFNFPIMAIQPGPGQFNRTFSINPQADGSFKLTLPEIEGRVGSIVGLPPGYRMTSLMYGSTDLLQNPFKVAATDTAELRATITTSGAAPVEVRGRVSGLEGVTLTVAPLNVSLITSQYVATLNATVRSDGLFVFPEVYPGNYTANVRGPGISGSPTVGVVVTSTGTSELEIPLPGQRDVPGRVLVEGGGALPVILLSSTPVPGSQVANGFSSAIPLIRPAEDGSFHVILQEGERRFGPFINLPPGYIVKSATYGSVELMNNNVRISRTDTSELRFTLVSSFAPVNVSGRVLGLDNSDPARFAVRVTLTSNVYAAALTQSVEPDGSFTFPSVSRGNYTLRLTGPRLPPGMPVKNIDVANSEVRDISLVVPGQKEVIGRAVIEGGGPLPRLTLRLSSGEPGSPPNVSLVPVNPQSDGLFRITLPTGQRAVDIQLPAGFTLQTFKYGDSDLRTNPVKVSTDDKAEIAITIKSTVPISWVKVSGRVTGMDPAASGVLVALTAAAFPQTLNVPVNPDGSFQFPQVSQGNYIVRLLGSVGAPIPQPIPVTVATKDVTDVAIVVTRQFIVRGRLVVSGDKTAGNRAMLPIAVEARRPGGQVISSAIATDTFTLSVETGDQTIAVGNVPQGYQLQSAVYGSTDLLRGPLRVNGPPGGEVVLTLKKLTSSPSVHLVSISGRVTGETSKIPAPRKLLISGPGPTDLHEVEIASNGEFKLKDISPGTYTIRVSGVSASIAAPETVAVSGKNVSNLKIAVH